MGNAAPAAEAAKFLETLKGSQLLPLDEAAKFEAQFANSGDPKAIARALIKANKVTMWQASQLLRGFRQFQVGKYTLQDQLGANETGRVYLAEHGKLGKKVSLKLLPKRLASDPKIVKRFLAEARIAAAIDHRNIMHVYDVDREGDQVFFVTEYVDGMTVTKLVEKEKKLPLDKAMSIFTQLVEGMAVAHDKGVVHGGLRPSTTLVDGNGNVKICDLGVASISDGTAPPQEESAEMPVDVMQYAAPERVNTPPSLGGDIYGLGGTLYFLLTGEHPKPTWRVTEHVKSKQISVEILTDLRTKTPGVPDPLRKLCALMLAPNPADRPKSCREIAKGLPALMQAGSKEPGKPAPNATPSASADAATTDTKSIPVIKTTVTTPAAKPLPRAKALPAAPAPAPKAKAAPSPTTPIPAPKKEDSGPIFVNGSSSDSAPFIQAEPEEEVLEPQPEGEYQIEAEAEAEGNGFGGIAINNSPANGFAINAGKPGTSSGVVTKPAADTTPAAAGDGKGKSNLPLILGLSIGGGVLALAGIIAVVLMFGGGGKGKDKKVVKNNDKTQNETTKKPAKPEEETPDESNPGESNPGEANPVTTPEVANNPPPAIVPPNPNPTVPAPVEPAPMPAPIPTEPQPAPTSEPMPQPAPMEPKPQPKPPAATEPFKGLPAVVTLPSLGTKGMVPAEAFNETKLGPTVLGSSDCYVDLFGGDFAFKGTQRFVLDAAKGGTSTTEWDIALQVGEGGTKTVVAKLMAKDESLVFQWLPAAADNAAAPYLCNCVVMLRAGKGQHELRLRTPLAGAPLDANSVKAIKGSWNVEFLPNPEKIKVEFLGVTAPIPNTKFEPKEFTQGGDPPLLWFGNTDTTMPLAIAFKPIFGRQFQMDGSWIYKTEQEQKPQAYSIKKVQAGFNKAMGMVSQITENSIAEAQGKNQEQTRQINDIAAAESAKFSKLAGAYEDAAKLHEALKGGVKVSFRLVYEADAGKLVEILTAK